MSATGVDETLILAILEDIRRSNDVYEARQNAAALREALEVELIHQSAAQLEKPLEGPRLGLSGVFLTANSRLIELLREGRRQRLNAIEAIQELLYLRREFYGDALLRTQNATIVLLRKNQPFDYETSAAASSLLGKLLRKASIKGLAWVKRVVSTRVRESLETLNEDTGVSEKSSLNRATAVLVLRQLAEYAPSSIAEQRDDICEFVWRAICDREPRVRFCAIDALRAFITVFTSRDEDVGRECVERLWSNAHITLKKLMPLTCDSSAAAVHGCMLALGAMLENKMARMRILREFDAFCELAENALDHPRSLVRLALFQLAPLLAEADPDKMEYSGLLKRLIEKLIELLKNSASVRDEVYEAFQSLGLIARAVGESRFEPFVRRTLDIISENLAERTFRKNCRRRIEAICCLGRVADSLKSKNLYFIRRVHNDLFSLIKAASLSEHLAQALMSIGTAIPELRPHFQTFILKLAAEQLNPTRFGLWRLETSNRRRKTEPLSRPSQSSSIHFPLSTSPSSATNFDAFSFPESARKKKPDYDPEKGMRVLRNVHDSQRILETLRIIGMFDFKGIESPFLVAFINDCITALFESPKERIRENAVKVCAHCAAASIDLEDLNAGGSLVHDISVTLMQVACIAVSDPDYRVRTAAIGALDKAPFDLYLAQSEIIRTLCLSLYDERFPVRKMGVSLVTRLMARNPAYVRPVLSSLVRDILSCLHYRGETMREAAELLPLIVIRASSVVRPYFHPIMKVLLKRLTEASRISDTGSAEPLLRTVAELVSNANSSQPAIGSDLRLSRYTKKLLPLIINALDIEHSESGFRCAALRALARIVQNTACVILPYYKHPKLLRSIARILRLEVDQDVRLEAQAVLGTLGAVDPTDVEKNVALTPMSENLGTTFSPPLYVAKRPRPLMDTDYYRRLAFPRSGPPHRWSWGISEESQTAMQSASQSTEDKPIQEGERKLGRLKHPVGKPNDRIMERYYEDEQEDFDGCSSDDEETYVPVWAHGSLATRSLVSSLPHPFTAHPIYFSAAVTDVLNGMLLDQKMKMHFQEIVTALRVVCEKSLPPKVKDRMVFYRTIVPRLLWLLRPGDIGVGDAVKVSILHDLGRLLCSAGRCSSVFARDVLCVLSQFISGNNVELAKASLAVITSLREALEGSSRPLAREMVSMVLDRLFGSTVAAPNMTEPLILCLSSLSLYLEADAFLALTAIIRTADNARTPVRTRRQALVALRALVQQQPVTGMSARIILPLTRILRRARTGTSEASDELHVAQEAAGVLVELAERASEEFLIFVSTIAKALRDSRMQGTISRLLQLQLLHADQVATMNVFRIQRQDVKNRIVWLESIRGQERSEKAERCIKLFHSLSLKRGFAVLAPNGATITSTEVGDLWQVHDIPRPHTVNRQVLRWAAKIGSQSSADDWKQWLIKFAAVLLNQSSSPALRACAPLCDAYPPLARDLFNASFLSCFSTDYDEYRNKELAMTIKEALESPSIPVDVSQTLLSLAEYMQHDEKPLPIPMALLAKVAVKCGAFAKALYYKEREFRERPRAALEGEHGLVSIYDALGHMDSAVGAILSYEKSSSESVAKKWYEKLRMWDDAIAYYEKAEQSETLTATDDASPDSSTSTSNFDRLLGRMRCYDQLGEWHKLDHVAQIAWDENRGAKAKLARIADEGRGASVAFDLGRYERFKTRLELTDPDSYTGSYYRALLAVQENKLNDAEYYLYSARKSLDSVLAAGIGESYPRAYNHVLSSQQLVEIEEIVGYKRAPSQRAKDHLQSIWDRRLMGCKFHRLVWYRALMVRSLVLDAEENRIWWLRFCSLCRKSGRLPMALEAFGMLLRPKIRFESTFESEQGLSHYENHVADLALNHSHPEVAFDFAKYLWARKRHESAYCLLKMRTKAIEDPSECFDDPRVLSEMLVSLATWVRHIPLTHSEAGSSLEEQLEYAADATKYDSSSYRVWHLWGLLNAERACQIMAADNPAFKSADSPDGPRSLSIPPPASPEKPFVISVDAQRHIRHAVKGLYYSIELDGRTKMQDQLKLLQLWHHYGSVKEFRETFRGVAENTNVDLWTEVIPQIITPLYTSNDLMQEGIQRLLIRIGNKHPQTTSYPLLVAKDAHHKKRTRIASSILDKIRKNHELVITSTEIFARELIRVTILWAEMWLLGLEDAARKFKVSMKSQVFREVVDKIEKATFVTPQTDSERRFQNLFAASLKDARRMLDEEDMRVAWEYYGRVREHLRRELHGKTKLYMEEVSPFLFHARDLPIAIPGTYRPHYKEKIFVSSVESQMIILNSKERPRKLYMRGSNGCLYGFLLKGHEDLRQDERIMQLFGLMNDLLLNSDEPSMRDVSIQRYLVVALSSNAGIIELVPNMDTIHALIKNLREQRRLLLNLELRFLTKQVSVFENLPLLQRVNVYENMMRECLGTDIATILWLRSRSSELWLERRTNYAESLAVSNLAGYILGVGDRHPSNIMMDRETGKLMHIDFADIFETSLKREDHPERVPFRLTRIFVQALEPCGVDGIYRRVSESFMRLLRKEKDSLMAILDAFVYDPIIRNRLGESHVKDKNPAEGGGQIENEVIEARAFSDVDQGEDTVVSDQSRAEPERSKGERYDSKVKGSERSVSLVGNSVASMKREVTKFNGDTRVVRARESQDRASNLSKGRPQAVDRISGGIASFIDYTVGHSRVSALNRRAFEAIKRVEEKLNGTDFGESVISVEEQVSRLIAQATSLENLCQHFIGWCPFW